MADRKDGADPRNGVWDRLRTVARPDSRLHFDFAHIHPDFEGSADATERLLAETELGAVRRAFVVPDGAGLAAREALLARGVSIVVSTYCMRRGFRLVDPARLQPSDFAFAATLDGVERFGAPLDLAELAGLGRIDLVVTGAAAVAANGARYGRSYQYFDIEWGLLAELGLVDDRTPVAVIVHDVQLTPDRIQPMRAEAVPDFIATPTRLIRVANRPRRPTGVFWSGIDPDEIEDIPCLVELQRLRGERR